VINDWHKAGYLPLGIYTTDDHRRSIGGGEYVELQRDAANRRREPLSSLIGSGHGCADTGYGPSRLSRFAARTSQLTDG
jgi:hypothetical protein